MKKKLIIMGAFAAILIILFTGSIIKKIIGLNDSHQEILLRDGDMITVEESIQLLRFLGLDKDQMDRITNNKEYLNFGQCLSLLELASQKLEVPTEEIISNLSFPIEEEPKNNGVLTDEFLDMYENILKKYPKETAPVVEKNIFVLGKPTPYGTDTNNQVMVTDQGDYNYEYAKSYSNFYTNGILNLKKSVLDKEIKSGFLQTDHTFQLSDYIDHKITALISGDHIVYIKEVLEEETILHNVWITKGKEDTISAFLNNISKDFITKYSLPQEIEGKVGDLVIQDGQIVKISIKPDVIQGKVLLANQKYIEIEGYGKLPVDDNYKIYKTYNELSMEVTNSILVGYEATDFVVADGKVVAALITEPIKAKNIRVLIKTNNFADLFHNEVKLTADRDFVVTIGKKKTTYEAGTELTFKPESDWMSQERVHIQTKSDNGKIKLLSVKRSDGNPSYRGSIEVAATEQGFIIINELSLEEYLSAVIPSEMPTYYGLEALKVQAICARSYAYKQLFANSYSEYGAHVDDSVSYQVYNNVSENKDSILAVKDTYGKVIKYKDEVITAYYFSTSCGHTASIGEVWGDSDSGDYLVGKLQTTYDITEGSTMDITAWSQDKLGADFSSENDFRDFILKPTVTTYDTEFPWYRWKVTISLEDLKKSIEHNIAGRYNANPALIQTLTGKDENGKEVYESIPVSSIGTVKEVKVGKREKSGIISELILKGSENTIKVSSEYNIRSLLAPLYDDVMKQDNTTASGLTMLPSSFFIIDKKDKEITLNGGGYGHGVGMSQNGVKAMTEVGIKYEDIIKHYYTGVDLGFIY